LIKQTSTHLQLLEKKFEGKDWVDDLIIFPETSFDMALWTASFKGESEQILQVPFQLSHLWIYLFEVGPVASGAMGPIPLPFREIQSWMETTSVNLSAWEVVLLHKCSQEWVSATHEAANPDAVPPWTGAEVATERKKRVSDTLMSALLSSKKGKK